MNLHEIINPFPKQKTKIYAIITDRSVVDDNKWLITMDLVNDAIKDLDNTLYSTNLDNNFKVDELKKYLFTYFMTIEVDFNTYDNSFKNLNEKELYEIELIPEKTFVKDNNVNLFFSNVYFSASPIMKKEYFVSFTGISLPMESTPLGISTFASKTDINTELNKIFTYDLKVQSFRVHRVGQGSCNSIIFKCQNDRKLFYDIGISKYVDKDQYHNLYSHRFTMFNLKKFETVIISHWDEDHYLGIYLDDSRELLNKTWITPQIKDGWFNVKRLGYLVSIFGNLIMIDDSITGHLYNKDDMFLFKGDGSGTNDSGIMVCLRNSTKNLVAMGDVSYRHASFILTHSHSCFSHIDYLIVPHHGALLDSRVTFSSKSPQSNAIISVGYNQYGHPNISTENHLASNGFTIIRTDSDERQIVKF